MKKIALIGSAPSSVNLAPYDDPSWTIWSCSPGAYPLVKRCDAHFEIHKFEPDKPWFTADYIAWMAKRPVVYMIEPVPALPNSVAYPKDAILEQFGPYFQTNSLSWMTCMAVASGATEIGLWGVDMAAQSEWMFQRTGLQTLLWYVNRHYNVKIILPPESDLWVPPPIYGFSEANAQYTKYAVRRAELDSQIAAAQNQLHVAQQTLTFFQGAKDDHEYHINTWVMDQKARSLSFCHATPPPMQMPKPDPLAQVYEDQPGLIAPPAAPANGHWPQAHQPAE